MGGPKHSHKSDKHHSKSRAHRSKSVKSSSKCEPCPPPPCPEECPSFDDNTPCPTPSCTPCKPSSCTPCPPPSCNPCPPPPCDITKWCDVKNICSMMSSCLPKGMWCDTMSCMIPCDKVYCITPNLKVRVNLYCNPFVDVVTVNGAPVFGCVDLPPLCFNDIIDAIAENTCAISCPVTLKIYEKLRTFPELSILVRAIDMASPEILEYLISCITTATLFAPNNIAFEELAVQYNMTVDELLVYLRDNDMLDDLLLNHMLPKVVFSAAFKPGQATKVLARSKECLQVYKAKQSPFQLCVSSAESEKAKVVDEDVLATNGVIHIINKVLVL